MNDTKLPKKTIASEQTDSQERLISKAREILHGKKVKAEDILELASKLKRYKSFSFARRILERTIEEDSTINQDKKLKLKFYQEWVLCTYKDDDLSVDLRLDWALRILEEVEDINTTEEQETLGLVGAIYKRKFEVDNQKTQLERSLLYYMKGYELGAGNDLGYTGINAAFVLDWLAFQEETEARATNRESVIAKEHREKATAIRKDIIEKISPLGEESAWGYRTLFEAYFGLKEYDKAIQTLKEEEKLFGKIPEWEEESSVQQVARLAILQSDPNLSGEEFEETDAWQNLLKVFGNHPAAVRNAFTGKIGLALSGGGFRASLFHIGTLAKLAELDVLQHLEAISCVSGGSIIGAHYYLEVRKLLQEKPEERINKQDYIKIIHRIEKDFLEGVQRNIRMRIIAELTTNLKMMFHPGYTRTKRAGELYEEELFSKVNDNEGDEPRFINKLNILPKDDVKNFNPKHHNWRRSAKVPMLFLNATTLNTGHNWQFTANWMGEPPSSIDVEVDTNDRLRRMYYTEAPQEHQNVRLGYAVSASAGVPGIFEPLSLDNLYPDRIVRLVDGGVCDNQGISSLLDQDCKVMLVSDGSGQMNSENVPSNGILGVPLRSNSILQSRVRDAQYQDLESRKRSSLLRGLMFIHLKEDLDTDPIDWVECDDPIKRRKKTPLTTYGIDKDIQKRLAATRTDLDSFTEVEAYALMTSAYRMTEKAFQNEQLIDGFSDDGEAEEWNFLKIEDSLKSKGKNYPQVKKLLGVSNSLFLKAWKLSKTLTVIAVLVSVFILTTIISLFISLADLVILQKVTIGRLGTFVATLVVVTVATFIFGFLVKFVRWRETLTRIAIGIGMCCLGWVLARIHLSVFDRLFLKYGRISSLDK